MAETASPPAEGQGQPVLKELSCPNCGSPVHQHIPDAQTLICPRCSTHINMGMDGMTSSRGLKIPNPRVPVRIGQKATFDGVEYIVLGRVLYQGWEPDDASDMWRWDEWLLGASDGRMLWMSYDAEDGFMLYKKLRIREAFNPRSDISIPVGNGKQARVSERYPAKIVGAEGELTWKANRDDQLLMVEGAGDGKKYSIQVTPSELEIYEGGPLKPSEVREAFGGQAWVDAAKRERTPKNAGMINTIGILCLVFAVAAAIIGFGANSTGDLIASQTLEVSQANPLAGFPIEFTQPQRPVMLNMTVQSTLPENTFADLDLIVVSPNEVETIVSFEEFWHETGIDEGVSWRESDLNDSEPFVPFLAGTHQIQVELGNEPPTELTRVNDVSVKVDVYGNYLSPNLLFGYAAIVGIIGVMLLMRSGGFNLRIIFMLVVGAVILYLIISSAGLTSILDVLSEF